MHERVWVVIPTYNEAANIEGIVRATAAELERLAPDAHRILIVDDNSPDGTGEIADRLAGGRRAAGRGPPPRREDRAGTRLPCRLRARAGLGRRARDRDGRGLLT